MARGDLSDGLIFDAIRLRLIEIGEAVKQLDASLLASEPDIAWSDAAGMRDWLAHHYFDTARARVEGTIVEDLPPLEAAVQRLLASRELTKEAPIRDRHDDLGIGL